MIKDDTRELEDSSAINAWTRFGHDFAQIPVHASVNRNIQPKLKVGASPDLSRDDLQVDMRHTLSVTPAVQCKYADFEAEKREKIPLQPRLLVGPMDDPYEREADAIAHQVMVMKASPVSRAVAQGGCASCASTDQFAPRRIVEDEGDTIQGGLQFEANKDNIMVQRPTRSSSVGLGTTTSELTSSGSPLPEATLQFYKARMGHDFSAVRLHRGDRASQLNRAFSARAFTYLNHIWLGSKEGHSPSFTLTHELAHVKQRTSPGGWGPIYASYAPPSIQRDLTPPGNCIQGIHDQLQRAVKAWCDHPSGRTCTPADSCHRLQQKIRRNQLCAQHRRKINDRCYEGGNRGHQQAERDARRAQATCMALYRIKCTRPPPVPVPERVARRIADWAREVVRQGRNAFDAAEEFLQANPELVGLVLAAGITAIIALIADDATLVGIADDVLIAIIGALEWVALRMSFGF